MPELVPTEFEATVRSTAAQLRVMVVEEDVCGWRRDKKAVCAVGSSDCCRPVDAAACGAPTCLGDVAELDRQLRLLNIAKKHSRRIQP